MPIGNLGKVSVLEVPIIEPISISLTLPEKNLLRKTHFPLGQSSISTQCYVLVAHGDRCPHEHLYAFLLRSSLSSFPLPLRGGDVKPTIDLQTIFAGVYERAGFDMVINF